MYETLISRATNTTRWNQLALIKLPQDPEVSSSLLVLTRVATIISSLLQIPRYIQLHTASLENLGQTGG